MLPTDRGYIRIARDPQGAYMVEVFGSRSMVAKGEPYAVHKQVVHVNVEGDIELYRIAGARLSHEPVAVYRPEPRDTVFVTYV